MKKGTKIAIGVGGTLILGVGGYFAYKHFSKKDGVEEGYDKGLFSSNSNSNETLSDIAEYAKFGVTQSQESSDTRYQNTQSLMQQRDRLLKNGSIEAAEKATTMLLMQGEQIKKDNDPAYFLDSCKNTPNDMVCSITLDKIDECRKNPNSARCISFKSGAPKIAEYLNL